MQTDYSEFERVGKPHVCSVKWNFSGCGDLRVSRRSQTSGRENKKADESAMTRPLNRLYHAETKFIAASAIPCDDAGQPGRPGQAEPLLPARELPRRHRSSSHTQPTGTCSRKCQRHRQHQSCPSPKSRLWSCRSWPTGPCSRRCPRRHHLRCHPGAERKRHRYTSAAG